jgi:hypothetical protein
MQMGCAQKVLASNTASPNGAIGNSQACKRLDNVHLRKAKPQRGERLYHPRGVRTECTFLSRRSHAWLFSVAPLGLFVQSLFK